MSPKLINDIENIYVINLERRKDRLAKFNECSKNIENKIEIVNAVDGSLIKINQKKDFVLKDKIILKNPITFGFRGLKIGEIGCFLSHYFLWKKISKLNKPCIIFEDDAKPINDYSNKLNYLLNQNLPEDIDILWLGLWTQSDQTRYYRTTISNLKQNIFNKNFYKLPKGYKTRQSYTYNYIIWPNSAKKLCDILENWHSNGIKRNVDAVDGFIHRNCGNEYVAFIPEFVHKFICSAPQGDTDIQSWVNKSNGRRIL